MDSVRWPTIAIASVSACSLLESIRQGSGQEDEEMPPLRSILVIWGTMSGLDGGGLQRSVYDDPELKALERDRSVLPCRLPGWDGAAG